MSRSTILLSLLLLSLINCRSTTAEQVALAGAAEAAKPWVIASESRAMGSFSRRIEIRTDGSFDCEIWRANEGRKKLSGKLAPRLMQELSGELDDEFLALPPVIPRDHATDADTLEISVLRPRTATVQLIDPQNSAARGAHGRLFLAAWQKIMSAAGRQGCTDRSLSRN